jgi:thiamine biosynthesis protein ThiC
MKELEIKKPIGDFIIKNAKGTQTENGVYYHYSEVCTLLKSYEKQLTLTNVVVPKGAFNCGKERAFGEERCKVQCKDCVIEYQYN